MALIYEKYLNLKKSNYLLFENTSNQGYPGGYFAEHTNHVFPCVAGSPLLFTIYKICIMVSQSNTFIAYATIFIFKGIVYYLFEAIFQFRLGNGGIQGCKIKRFDSINFRKRPSLMMCMWLEFWSLIIFVFWEIVELCHKCIYAFFLLTILFEIYQIRHYASIINQISLV